MGLSPASLIYRFPNPRADLAPGVRNPARFERRKWFETRGLNTLGVIRGSEARSTAMRTYIDISFSSGGMIPTVVIERIQSLAEVKFILGEHDIVFDWRTVAEFQRVMKSVHAAFGGTGVTYRVHTVADESDLRPPVVWPPTDSPALEENPAYPKRAQRPDSEERKR